MWKESGIIAIVAITIAIITEACRRRISEAVWKSANAGKVVQIGELEQH